MLDVGTNEQLKKGLPTLWIIWGAMVFSLVLYLVVADYVAKEIPLPKLEPDLRELLRTVMIALSLVELLIAVWLRKRLLAGKYSPRTTSPRSAANHLTPLVAGYLSGMMICLALCESVGIYGFVLFLLGEPPATLYGFVGVAILGMFLFRPRLADLENLALRKGAESH